MDTTAFLLGMLTGALAIEAVIRADYIVALFIVLFKEIFKR